MSSSSGMKKITELKAQDEHKERDFNPVAMTEDDQDRIVSETTSYNNSFFSYIVSFYTPTESSESSDSTNEIPHNKHKRKKPCSTKNNLNAENRLPTNVAEDNLLAKRAEDNLPAREIAEEIFQGNNEVRKQKSDSANWVRNIRKAARIKGKPYISTTGVIQPGKILKEPCTCRKKCFEKFSEKDREMIFMEFYKLSEEAQNQQLANSIEEYLKKTVRLRNRNTVSTIDRNLACTFKTKDLNAVDTRDKIAAGTREGNATSTRDKNTSGTRDGNAIGIKDKNTAGTSRRSYSRKYFLSKPSMERIEVCQTMFLNTLAVTQMKVRLIVQKKRIGSDVCFEDGRGKHGKQKQTAEKAKQSIRNNTAKFPAYNN